MPHLVRDWMSSPVVVVDPDSSVSYALTLMRRRKIHSVVVDAV
ncbi:MAG TPA: histidine kinase, partial [Anaerolineae bacterium]|nr:histidine kinase [Anaerolineae bacterium]